MARNSSSAPPNPAPGKGLLKERGKSKSRAISSAPASNGKHLNNRPPSPQSTLVLQLGQRLRIAHIHPPSRNLHTRQLITRLAKLIDRVRQFVLTARRFLKLRRKFK